jgi:hypothetical protein
MSAHRRRGHRLGQARTVAAPLLGGAGLGVGCSSTSPTGRGSVPSASGSRRAGVRVDRQHIGAGTPRAGPRAHAGDVEHLRHVGQAPAHPLGLGVLDPVDLLFVVGIDHLRRQDDQQFGAAIGLVRNANNGPTTGRSDSQGIPSDIALGGLDQAGEDDRLTASGADGRARHDLVDIGLEERCPIA